MDDGLVLNLATPEATSSKARSDKKGGRWTDRLKAKRVAKRKTRHDESHSEPSHPPQDDPHPAKRPRKAPPASDGNHRKPASATHTQTAPAPRPSGQIISSLFSSNPRIEKPEKRTGPAPKNTKPSNAPLDSSTFSGLGLDPLIITHISTKMKISQPTSIQRAALPSLLSGGDDGDFRDVFIQSQTGSGKTLSFLLPIIQDLLPLSSHSYIDRSIGTFAIIIAPTRELAKQISDVLEALLQLRLRPQDESPDSAESGPRLTRWLVSGLLTGGGTRTHEKARLRKGIPILVSTPGRLLDHLQNTASFNVGKCRWLVLDEADRLMELGFEETIQGILRGLDGRRKLAMQAVDEGKSTEVGGWDWNRKRRTILCSATIREDVQKLAGTTLTNPIVIKATASDAPPLNAEPSADGDGLAGSQKFTPPSQLTQRYVIAPLKLRLVTLIALLRSLLAQSDRKRGTKIIVFLSCTDSVDFHWHLLGGMSMDGEPSGDSSSDEAEGEVEADPAASDDDAASDAEGSDAPKTKQKKTKKLAGGERVQLRSPLFPDTAIFRLHGSLATPTRIASLKGFSSRSDGAASSILLCTSVASRGLDLPLVRAVVQYDLPTEAGATEYVHRVGRTARAGKGGEAWSIVAPSEKEWAPWVQAKMQGDAKDGEKNVVLEGVSTETVLQRGFGGKGAEYEERATEVQLGAERWVLRDKKHADMARKAFLSHMRAYATHPSDEKHIFHIRHLHLGHLAKAFALRDAPTAVNGNKRKAAPKPAGARGQAKQAAKSSSDAKHKRTRRGDDSDDDDFGVGDAEKRMEKVVRAQGRLTKKGGKMVSSGTSEFQIAGGYDLEKLVQSGVA